MKIIKVNPDQGETFSPENNGASAASQDLTNKTTKVFENADLSEVVAGIQITNADGSPTIDPTTGFPVSSFVNAGLALENGYTCE